MSVGQPSIIIIARHGARLDQADKDWHSKSDQPWDAPLSYGGWIQSQNLGARIANELEILDRRMSNESVASEGQLTDSGPRKRRKIVIHTSPFLRCVQTSIGVAAGMRYPTESAKARPLPTAFQRSSLSISTLAQDDSEPSTGKAEAPNRQTQQPTITPPTLKIDAFLGEWLSSGYYEKTGPPPESCVLVKNAKSGLQKPPEEIKGADLAKTAVPEFDEGDSENKENSVRQSNIYEKSGYRSMAAFGPAVPKRSMTITFGKEIANGANSSPRNHRRVRSSTYSPPIPTYSIAPQDSIPIGFVAHARDACVDIDMDWDSENIPLAWGDGGQYEEEWSTMHRRFRNGLQQMLSYYEMQAIQAEVDDPDAQEEETVLIIVTHQAGCNALIRLVTGAPALHDVGTASLTLAVRKKNNLTRRQSIKTSSPEGRRRGGSLDLGLGDDFDLRMIAATEHLRTGSVMSGINSPRLGQSPGFGSRRIGGMDAIENFSIDDPSWRRNSVQSLGRSSSLRSHAADSPSIITANSGSGLWNSKPSRHSSFGTFDSIDPKSSSTSVQKKTIHEEDEGWMPDGTTTETPITVTGLSSQTWKPSEPLAIPIRSANQPANDSESGLWGGASQASTDKHGLWATSGSSFGEDSIARARSPGKRRWTAMAGAER